MTIFSSEALSEGASAELQQIVDFVINLVKSEKGFEHFSIDESARMQLAIYTAHHSPHPLIEVKEPLTTAEFSANVLDALAYLKETASYIIFKKKVDREHLPKILEDNAIPKEAINPFFNKEKPIKMESKDCLALKDWPDHRLYANGHSGRKENAGQFIKRLFEQGFYTEKKFGKLYWSDLRKINHKLYQALIQWHKRYPDETLDMLGNQHDKVEARQEAYERGDLGDNFIELSRVHTSNSRKKQAAP